MSEKAKQRALVKFITDVFNNKEISDLYFSAGVDIEDVGVSQSGKSAKARELVLYAARRSEEYETGKHRSYMYPLLEAIAAERPEADVAQFAWLEWPYPGSSSEAAAPPSSVSPKTELLQTAVSTTPPPTTTTTTPLPTIDNNYLNFDITIAAKGEKYTVSAASVKGENEQPIVQSFPPKDADFTDALYYLRELMGAKQDAEQLGRVLQTFLFPREIQSLFDLTRARAKSEGRKGVRIRLRITNDIPEIARIPWEYCWDDRTFMALGRATPIVRYTPVKREAQSTHTPEKVRILLVTASPKNHEPIIDLAAQEKRVQDGLAKLVAARRVELRVLSNATKRDLRLNFSRFDPHILHFVGHGLLEGDEGVLLLEDDDGNKSEMTADDMYILTQTSDVKLVILSACETAARSETSSDAIMGVAPILVAAGVPAVVAMQFEIPEKTAISFTRDLYQFLADGEPLDAAITEARIGAYIDNNDKIFWAIPVLFMRSPDGRIW